jgi:hypothetical protein
MVDIYMVIAVEVDDHEQVVQEQHHEQVVDDLLLLRLVENSHLTHQA